MWELTGEKNTRVCLSLASKNGPLMEEIGRTWEGFERHTIQIVGRVEGVQGLLTPLHEGVLLALVDTLKQLQQLLLLFYLLVDSPTQRVAWSGQTKTQEEIIKKLRVTHIPQRMNNCFPLNKYLWLALPLLFFCALPFLLGGGCWVASFTASSQKPMLELWVSPQILLSEAQLVQVFVFTEPQTEFDRDVCLKKKQKKNNSTSAQVCL